MDELRLYKFRGVVVIASDVEEATKFISDYEQVTPSDVEGFDGDTFTLLMDEETFLEEFQYDYDPLRDPFLRVFWDPLFGMPYEGSATRTVQEWVGILGKGLFAFERPQHCDFIPAPWGHTRL